MPQYTNGKQYSKYDIRGVPTIADIFPRNSETSSLLVLKDGRTFRSVYNRNHKAEVVRAIFFDFLLLVLEQLVEEGGMFVFPNKQKTNIAVKKMDSYDVVRLRSDGKYHNIDVFKTNFTIPTIKYDFGINKRKKDRFVYIPKRLSDRLLSNAEDGRIKYTYYIK